MSDPFAVISNPILRGFNPDPSIVRVGGDYYIATSTFEWFPGVQIHHSRDLAQAPSSKAAPATRVLLAARSGFFSSLDCKQVGWAVQRLGAGRAKPGDPVSASAGIELHCKLGNRVQSGHPLITLYADTEAQLAEPYNMLQETVRITDERPELQPLIREIVRR